MKDEGGRTRGLESEGWAVHRPAEPLAVSQPRTSAPIAVKSTHRPKTTSPRRRAGWGLIRFPG